MGIYVNKINAIPANCENKPLSFFEQVACAKSTFSVQGRPINPRIIQELLTGLSDTGDQIVSIDLLDSQNSNRFFVSQENISVEPFGKFFKVSYKDPECDPSCQFSYVVQGKTDNGLYVLTTSESGEGSGVFNSLLLLKIKEGEGGHLLERPQMSKKQEQIIAMPQKRLVIEKVAELGLGDRTGINLEIKNNTIKINIFPMFDPKQDQKTILLNLSNL